MRIDVEVMQLMVDDMVGTVGFAFPARGNINPKPAEEFAHVRLIEEYPVGIPTEIELSNTDTTVTTRLLSCALLRFRIGIVETSGIAAVRIMHGWTSETMKALMISTGYGFIKCEPISNEDALLEKEWEFRNGFAVEMYNTRAFDQTVGSLDSLVISGEFYEDPFIHALTINVNE